MVAMEFADPLSATGARGMCVEHVLGVQFSDRYTWYGRSKNMDNHQGTEYNRGPSYGIGLFVGFPPKVPRSPTTY